MNKENKSRTMQTVTKQEPKKGNPFRRSEMSVFMRRSKGQSIEDFAINVIRAMMEKGMLTKKPGIVGGDGSSAEKALIVIAVNTQDGVSAQKAYLESKCGKWDIDYTIDRQMQIDHNNRKYDLIYVTMKKDGSKREFWFDVTPFFGKL